MEHIGHNIRRMRDAANMSQQKLAEMAGISKSQLSRLESGEQDNPSIKTLIPIAAALGASIEEIVYGESSKTMDFMTKA
ncbi:helix-turn-helix domain-containing protein, partial [Aeromonas sp. HMWF015]